MIWILKVILQELISIEKKLKNEDLWVYYHKEVDQEGWGCSLCVSHSLPYFSCLYPLPFTMFVLYPISFPMGILVRLVGCYGLPSLLIRSALFASRLSLSASPRSYPYALPRSALASLFPATPSAALCSLARLVLPLSFLFRYYSPTSLPTPCLAAKHSGPVHSIPFLCWSIPYLFDSFLPFCVYSFRVDLIELINFLD